MKTGGKRVAKETRVVEAGVALVPSTATGTPASSAATGTLVPMAATRSLARMPDTHDIVRDGGVVMVEDVTYLAHGHPIPGATAFFDRVVHPQGGGPWLGEADKVAWLDPASGYECIMLRAKPGGFLGGYVGVPVGHPLHGFEADAVPADLGIEVHGGLSYARICREGPTPSRRVRYEARRICHVAIAHEPLRHATDHRVADAHLWWFGFVCNHIVDVVPGDARHAARGAAVGVVQTYRDDAYVLGEVRNLAAQLRAVADGETPPSRIGPPLPAASLDPRRSF